MWYVEDSGSDIKFDDQDNDFYGRDSPILQEGLVHASSSLSFERKLKDRNRGLALFGTVPPPKKLEMGQVNLMFEVFIYSIGKTLWKYRWWMYSRT